MNKIEKLILENQRMLLWENWRTYFVKCGNQSCTEMTEIEDQVDKINKLLKPTNEPGLREATKDTLGTDGKMGEL